MMFYFLIGIVVVFCIIHFVLKPYLKPRDTVELWVGTNGSGKTLNAVKKDVIPQWRKNVLKVKLHNFFHRKNKIPLPIILSNIPIKYKGKIVSYVLKPEHLLCMEKIPLYSVVFVDEISLWLSQMDYKNPNIKICDDFATLCRHYFAGSFIMTTQDPNKVPYPYRYCTGSAFVLSDFKKHWWGLYKVASSSIRHISITGDIQKIEIGQKEDNEERIYTELFTKNYDSRAFSERYNTVPLGDFEKHTCMKVKKILKCPNVKMETKIEEK